MPFVPDAAPPNSGFVPDEGGGLGPVMEPSQIQSGLAHVAKIADIAGGPSRTLLATIAQKLTGKNLVKPGDWAHALNPITDTQRAPDIKEYAKRAGATSGFSASDILPIYAKKGSLHPALQPEVGGMLDPSVLDAVGFAGDVASDPLSWLSMGGAGIAKDAAQTASKTALEQAAREGAGRLGKTVAAVGDAAQPVADLLAAPGRAAQAIPGAKIVTGAAQLPSTIIEKLGKLGYKSVVRPVEFQGAKYGKGDIADTLFNAGIKMPFGLPQKAGNAAGVLMDARDKLLAEAGQAGGVASMESAVAPLRARIAKIRATGDPEAGRVADALESRLNEYVQLEKPTPGEPATPGTPPSTREVPSSILGPDGQPLTRTETIPGSPGSPGTPDIPGKQVTPAESSAYKTSLYDSIPQGAFAEATKTKLGERLKKMLAGGMKEETEAATARALGPQAGENLRDLNDSAGKLLGTRGGQASVATKAERELDKLGHLGGSDIVASGAGAISGSAKDHTGLGMLLGIIANKLRQGGQLMTMPGGYALRKLGEGQFSGPAIDSLTRQAVVKNPWALLPKGDQK